MLDSSKKLWKVTYMEYYCNHVASRKIRMFISLKTAQDFVYAQIKKLIHKENYQENYNSVEGLKITYDIKSSNVIYNCEYTVVPYKEGELV